MIIKKYHYIYKTTCKLNNKYYIGMHSTDDIEDGYMGSGLIINRLIKKYGKNNFDVEILGFYGSREELRLNEFMLVGHERIMDPLCVNLIPGGTGGSSFHGKKHTGETINKMRNSRKNKSVGPENSQYGKIWITDGEKNKKISDAKDISDGWILGRSISRNKKLIRKSESHDHKGSNNSQYGTKWITDGNVSIKIKAGDVVPDGWKYGYINEKLSGFSWITDGSVNRRMEKGKELPDGWKIGKVRKIRNYEKKFISIKRIINVSSSICIKSLQPKI